MKVLIAGAAGQLGRSLPPLLGAHTVVALEHSALDIATLASVRDAIEAHEPDIVVNAAAFNQVDAAENDPAPAFCGNALGPRNLAIVTAAHGIPIVHVSSDYVFDGTGTRPYHEFDRPNPRSAYGASKLAGEVEVRNLNPRHYIVRTAWVYHEVGGNFCNTMRAQAQRPFVRVVSDQYGSPTYAPHLAGAIVRLMETHAFGTYHCAGDGGTSWFDLTRAVYEAVGISTAVHPVATSEFPRPAPRPRYAVLTTLQDPAVILPPWREGVAAYAASLQRNGLV